MQATLDEINALAQVAAAEDRQPAPKAPAHPYEAVGLGVAPFQCVDIRIDESGETRCAYCTTRLKYCFIVADVHGHRFTVGCECVKQAGGAVAGFEKFNRQMQGRVAEIRKKAQQAKKAATVAKLAEQWATDHAEEVAFLNERAPNSNFYASLQRGLAQWGSLSPNQLAAVHRDMARCAAATAPQAAQSAPAQAPAPAVTLQPLHEAFDRASAAGIVHPRLRLGEFVFTPAKAESANPGAIYIKAAKDDNGLPGAYLGKVLGGKFLKSRDCSDATQAVIVELSKDPKAAAIAYGKKFGRCSVCARELTDEESVAAGIGPVCAKRYGF